MLVHAANEDSELHRVCLRRLEESRRDPAPTFLTWAILYEFIRVVTHRRVLPNPWSAPAAWRFVEQLLRTPGCAVLTATERHAVVLAQTLAELPDLRGNVVHDLHTAALMREHGVSRICTRDTDFHRFPFLTVIDPLRRETGAR